VSSRIEVAYCYVCRWPISRLSPDPWSHNSDPVVPHEAIPDRVTIRDLMSGPLR
jgi:hypothetical protein